jgi:hypothetical protein
LAALDARVSKELYLREKKEAILLDKQETQDAVEITQLSQV